MNVTIKSFDVNVNVKSSGIEFQIKSPDDSEHLGDCFVTMTGLVWCKGKTSKVNGIKLSWEELTTILGSAESKKAALKAAKSV